MKKISILLFLVIAASTSFGQMTNTSYDELIYDRLESIESLDEIELRDLSQKPVSLWKIYYLIDSVDSHHGELLKQETEHQELSGWQVKWLENISSNMGIQQTILRPIAINGISEDVQAFNQPFYFPFSERRFQRSIWNVETGHRLAYKRNFEIYLRPQFTLAMHPDENSTFRFKNAWIRTQFRNLEFQLGRDEMKWHISNSGADLYGNGGPTFDMFKVITPNAFRLPWFLKHIGQFKFSTYFAHQGESEGVTKAMISAWRGEYQFFRGWNLVVEHSVMLGGGDNPWPSFKDFLAEYVGFIFKAGNPFPSDHRLIYALSYTKQNIKFYTGVTIEDTDTKLKLQLWRNALWKWGMVKYSRNNFLRFEIAKSGPRVFKHHIYNNPTLMQEDLLNFSIGPDAFSLSSELGIWMNQYKDLIKTQAQFYFRSSDVWQIVRDGKDFVDVVRTENNPEEFHYILKAKYFKQLKPNLNFVGKIGLDVVQNSNFEVGNTDFNYLLSGELIYRPLLQK